MRRLLTRLLLTVSLALVPALGFQIYTEGEVHRIRKQLVEDEALRLVHLVGAEQQRIAEGAQQALNLLIGTPAVQDGELERCRRILGNLLSSSPRYDYAAVIGLDGRVVCGPGPIRPDIDLSDRAYFRLALQTGGFVIGEYTVGRYSGKPTIHMAEPFRDGLGDVKGVVEVGLSLAWLGEQLDKLSLPAGAAVSITDRSGVIIARTPDGERYVGKPEPPDAHFSLHGTEARVVEMTGLDGAPRIVAFSPLEAETKGLRIGVGLDRDRTFATVAQANRTGLVLIVLGALLALATTALVGTRLIGRPVNRLLAAADQWRGGNFETPTGLKADSSEFGRLGAAFDAMAASLAGRDRALQEREAALRRLTGTLEARVREEVAAREAGQERAVHGERIQALGQLAGGIAHDFNNVLQAVEGAVVLIERYPGDEAGVRRLARLALGALSRGASVTRRLLAFGRRGDLRSEAVDTGDLLAGLREILRHTLGTSTEVALRVEAGVAPMLADKGQLETALVNLATNARDAMPDGGVLTLSAATEIVPAEGPLHRARLAPGAYVRLAVADTGTGMEPATLARVTEPFFTTKAPGVGTGLGLAMAKGFAGQSGGALEIESRPGEGTTVTLWLPQAERPQAAASPPDLAAAASAPGGSASPVRVLLVDDDDVVREVLAEHLEEAGHTVLAAGSGAEAIALLDAGEQVDVVVSDLAMAGMNGLAVIRAAQERSPGLPAVLLTGYAGEGAALAMGESVPGTFSLLRKPVGIQALLDCIRALLARRASVG